MTRQISQGSGSASCDWFLQVYRAVVALVLTASIAAKLLDPHATLDVIEVTLNSGVLGVLGYAAVLGMEAAVVVALLLFYPTPRIAVASSAALFVFFLCWNTWRLVGGVGLELGCGCGSVMANLGGREAIWLSMFENAAFAVWGIAWFVSVASCYRFFSKRSSKCSLGS